MMHEESERDCRPPAKCELCSEPVVTVYVDGFTYQTSPGQGRKCCMCLQCYAQHGTGLSASAGQQYEKQDSGAWKKVRG